MRKWLVGGLALLVLVAAVASLAVMTLVGGPTTAGPEGVAPPTSAAGPARTAPEPGLQTFYDQELDWQPCDNDNDCAELTVPLDYADPGGATLELAVLRRSGRSGERIGSLVVNPGGPGASGTQYADDAAVYFRSQLIDRFDVVGFDPRGVGQSEPIDCLPDAELDAWVSQDPTPEDPQHPQEFVRQARGFGQGCERRSGDLLPHVGTIDAARDMDVLRAALDEDTLLYFGASYGTKLGATYAMLFPQRVGRLVLDGAVDMAASATELSLQQAGGFQTALDAYLRDCLRTAPCYLGDSLGAAQQRLKALLASIRETPLPAGGRQLLVGNAFYGIVAPLYNREYWFLLTNALKDALGGDGAALLQLSDAYTERQPDGTFGSNLIEANLAINCVDDPEAQRAPAVRRLLPEFEKASPVFGDMFAWGTTGCLGFGAITPEAVPDQHAEGAAPIVVVGTTRDPATPLAWAKSLAGQLSSGVLVTRDGDGHTGYNAGNDCVDEALERYLITGEPPEDGLAC